ncbi:STE3-domain-containing protein [Trametes versicolor FP-101664 SS1]|uniref:STE3-domain-containing protein n=1 Tax=Trametes versicolor (strain FP-101664) TaxID=717944 RepID=UPI00046245B2|nr:STE3-domain-containing protein [Trametes versicolor FP-101664 SS1]EIW56741.1 STE3-domain-containing protein [Trametes versicolor FP-101664 SS1]
MTVDPTWPAYPIVSFLGFIIALVPLPWHLQAWNSGTCYYMIWTALGCLNEFVNSVIFAQSAVNVAPVWCDISTRIIIGQSVGIPIASLCISRRLYNISRVSSVMVTRAEKRRVILQDTLCCVLFPIICMVLSYIVQGHRFNIFENLGCYPAIYNTLPTYFLVYMWPILIGIISSVYCILSLIMLLKRHAQFREFLQTGGALTVSRYYRLMALAVTEIVFTIPLGVYELYSNAIDGALHPWLGWDDAHFDFSVVEEVPAVVWRAYPKVAIPLEMSRWVLPVCAFVFFGYFGFAEEARRHYKLAWKFVSDRFAFFRLRVSSRLASHSELPSHSQTKEDFLPPYVSYPKPPAAAQLYGGDSKIATASLGDLATIKSTFGVDLSKVPSTPSTPSTPYSAGSTFTDRSSFASLPSSPGYAPHDRR